MALNPKKERKKEQHQLGCNATVQEHPAFLSKALSVRSVKNLQFQDCERQSSAEMR